MWVVTMGPEIVLPNSFILSFKRLHFVLDV